LLTRQSGSNGTETRVDEWPGACHKRFRTEAQAEAFIEDWKDTFADVWRQAVKEGLDRGLRPCTMKLSVDWILHGNNEELEEESDQNGSEEEV
jgi:hypothetical protein